MFLGGELSGDNTRVSMALAVAQTQRTGAEVKALEPKFEQVHVYFDSLSPPKYPGKIDTKLAEEGAILFHDKDLWADARNTSIPQARRATVRARRATASTRRATPRTRRSCPTPRLKGIEANITPIETIGTDPARTRLVNEQFKRAWNTSWWGYDDLNPKWTKEGQGRAGTTFERLANDYNAQNSRLEGPNKWSNSPIGYEAPPLYGAWASAPYFHNGSVPTIRDVLQPDQPPGALDAAADQAGAERDRAGPRPVARRLRLRQPRLQVLPRSSATTGGRRRRYVPCQPKGQPAEHGRGRRCRSSSAPTCSWPTRCRRR